MCVFSAQRCSPAVTDVQLQVSKPGTFGDVAQISSASTVKKTLIPQSKLRCKEAEPVSIP